MLCAQLMEDSNASFCVYPPNDTPVLSFNGKVTFVEDIAFKTRVMEGSPMVKNNDQTPENRVFKLFYLEIEEVKIYIPGKGTTREALVNE